MRKQKEQEPSPPERIEIQADDLRALVERTKVGRLSPEDYSKLKKVIEMFLWLMGVIESAQLKISDLKRQLFGSKSEKTKDVLDEDKPKPKPKPDAEKPKPKRKGHGRNSADKYTGATKHECHHETLKVGDICPECKKGKLYAIPPSSLVIVTGQAPLIADRYDSDRLRCNLCGVVFTAPLPAAAKRPKYDETCASIIALLKYGSGMPFNRLARLLREFGIPLPDTTQWEILLRAYLLVFALVFTELIRQAAKCRVIYNDDTRARILSRGSRDREGAGVGPESDPAPEGRTGIHTTGIVAEGPLFDIALFFTGWRHAGENIDTVLRERPEDLAPPIQMCDGLDLNEPKENKTILGNCLTHGRRHFVKLLESFPKECRFVILAIRRVYKIDAQAKEEGLSPEERLQLHQEKSARIMARLLRWMRLQLELRKVEPNSPLGKAIKYMQKRWEKLTLFLRVAGAPLDSNIVERALKMVIVNRKNALFFKTDRGAQVADACMSMIHTCRLNGENPWDYLNELQRNAKHVQQDPSQWMPWNYRATLAGMTERSAPQQVA